MARTISQYQQLRNRLKNCRTVLKAQSPNSKLIRLAMSRKVLLEPVEWAKIISPRSFRSKLKAEASRTTQPISKDLIGRIQAPTQKLESKAPIDKDHL